MRRASLLCLFSCLAAAACQQAPAPALAGLNRGPFPLAQAVEAEGEVLSTLVRSGEVYIAGQPDEAALRWFRDQGVVLVFNIRTPPEMTERVPFDEAALVRELGMDYVHVPQGGDEHPYGPEAVEAFAQALERHDAGRALLHCTVAWRASHLWAAYLVRYHGYSLEEAWAHGEAINLGELPLQRMLHFPTRLEPVPDS